MLDVKFFGKEPEVVLAAVASEINHCGVMIKGNDMGILLMLGAIVNSLKRRMPKILIEAAVEAAFDEDAAKVFEKSAVIDMNEFKRQSGK